MTDHSTFIPEPTAHCVACALAEEQGWPRPHGYRAGGGAMTWGVTEAELRQLEELMEQAENRYWDGRRVPWGSDETEVYELWNDERPVVVRGDPDWVETFPGQYIALSHNLMPELIRLARLGLAADRAEA